MIELKMQLLGGHQRKASGQIKSHLVTEDTHSAGTRTVTF